jgi:signal transduction histidine kinase
LPLSYASIALLAALALGAVLLLTLRSHYLRVEQDYLESNAQAVGLSLAQLLEDEQPLDALQAQVESFAFLSDTRVQLLDPEGELLAGSSLPGRLRVAVASGVRREPPLPEDLPALETEGTEQRFFLRLRIEPPITNTTWMETAYPLSPPEGQWLHLFDDRLSGPELLFLGTDLGLEERPDSAPQGVTSSQVVTSPMRDSQGQLLGFVRLSEGPAYAQEIVEDVAWGWGIASVVAVVMAACAGWLVSRRMCAPLEALTGTTAAMAAGDLAARADVNRRDELGDLARSFNKMADQVEETVVTLRRFVSDAAHEIHTPLTALRTNLELAREDAPPGRGGHVEEAEAQVQRLEGLTAGLLDLSRIEAGTGTQPNVLVPLLPLLQELGELYASRAEQAGLDFQLSLPESPVGLQGDAAQLRRALGNLLDNAIKFTPRGGMVQLGLSRDGNGDGEGGTAVLWVEDSGPGIPAEDLPHLFQRFYRGRNASGYPGSGLGLAIVKAIAERHGGEVQAENTAAGARFTMRLPIG